MIRRNVQPHRSPSRHRGAILIVALVVTATLAGMVLALGQEMRVEAEAAANRAAAAQADAIERGAEQYVMGMLANPDDPTIAPTDLPEAQFQGVQVGDGYFWIVRPDYDDDTMPVFGLTDEGAKININAANQIEFINLLGGDTDTMTAITDWKNPISTDPTDDQYYNALADPYVCKHAPYETVEELLMVRNITRPWLLGDGTAPPLGVRNGVSTPPSGNNALTDAQLARGVYDLLTVSSIEPTNDPDGNALVKVTSQSSLNTLLTTKLTAGRAQSILSPFTFGGRRPNRPQDIFDLYSRGKMTDQELDEIADYIASPNPSTTTAQQQAAGTTPPPAYSPRINVDTAPPAVLYSMVGLNGMATEDIDKIVAARQANPPQAGALAWVADAITKQKAVGLGRYVTARSYQFSADIVAVSGNGRAFKRVRVVFDTSSVATDGTVQATYRRDISDRGWPMDPQILASLRAGQGISGQGASGQGGGQRGGGQGIGTSGASVNRSGGMTR